LSGRHFHFKQLKKTANERIIDPALKELSDSGFKASGVVRHGDVADTLNTLAIEQGAEQIIVCRSSEGGFAQRIFGSSTGNLVMHASVPVTVIG
jgi:nucleotide-binding universal stress UspA family protein